MYRRAYSCRRWPVQGPAAAGRTRYDGCMIRTAILTVSDRGAAGEREDTTVEAVRQVLAAGPYVEVDYRLVPDEQALIRAKLRVWCDSDDVDLILTNGGTGLGMRDRTPEATRDVIERDVPGIAELMRARGAQHSPLAALSRAIAGVRRKTLIVNLPGSPAGARQSLEAVTGVLGHAVDLVSGATRSAPDQWHG